MEPVFNCEHCGATLRVKPASLKILRSVQCSKCKKKTAVPQELIDAARSGALSAAPAAADAPAPEKTAAAPPTPPAVPAAPAAPAAPVAAPVPPPPAPAAGDRIAEIETRLGKAERTISILQAELATMVGAEAEAAMQRSKRMTDSLVNLGKQ